MNEAVKVVKGRTLWQACKQREEGEGIPDILALIQYHLQVYACKCICVIQYSAKATHCFIGCLARAKHANSSLKSFMSN